MAWSREECRDSGEKLSIKEQEGGKYSFIHEESIMMQNQSSIRPPFKTVHSICPSDFGNKSEKFCFGDMFKLSQKEKDERKNVKNRRLSGLKNSHYFPSNSRGLSSKMGGYVPYFLVVHSIKHGFCYFSIFSMKIWGLAPSCPGSLNINQLQFIQSAWTFNVGFSNVIAN